jgi:sec-independent protein translocase protein TatA
MALDQDFLKGWLLALARPDNIRAAGELHRFILVRLFWLAGPPSRSVSCVKAFGNPAWNIVQNNFQKLPGLTRVANGAYNEVYKESVMRSIGPMELLVILGIAVLLFGGKKIPEVAKGLGEGIRNFKTALKGDDENKPEDKKPV